MNPEHSRAEPQLVPRGLNCTKSQQTMSGRDGAQGLTRALRSGCPGGAGRSKPRENPTTGERGSARQGENQQRDSLRWKLPLKLAARGFRAEFEPLLPLYKEVYCWTAVPGEAFLYSGALGTPDASKHRLGNGLSPATRAAQHLSQY